MTTITGTAKRERTRHGFATITLDQRHLGRLTRPARAATGSGEDPYSRWRQR